MWYNKQSIGGESMNLLYLQYAVEVEKTGSINKAAENLFMGQPNLSRAIKELEASLGITIFTRSSKGMVPTTRGEEFLYYAKKVLSEVDIIENLYKNAEEKKEQFSISVPRTSYIAYAFTEFSKKVGQYGRTELFYKETNALRAIKNILENDYHLGIVRYACKNNSNFKKMFEEKGLVYEPITEFTYRLVMSENHPLSGLDKIRFSDLTPYTEIAHADPYVPSLSMAAVKKEELPDNTNHRIFVFERASQFELLSENHRTFMWVAPVPERILQRYGLVQKPCVDNTKKYMDLLIYRKDYVLSQMDKIFITELCEAKRKFIE